MVRLATELGLPLSRLIAQSKTGYMRRHPQHAVIFNATIADASGRRLWRGNVDLTKNEDILVQLTERAQLDLYVYYEGDSRRGFVETIDPTAPTRVPVRPRPAMPTAPAVESTDTPTSDK